MASYSTSIADASNLKAAMNTNSAYEGLCHPMKEEQGGTRWDVNKCEQVVGVVFLGSDDSDRSSFWGKEPSQSINRINHQQIINVHQA